MSAVSMLGLHPHALSVDEVENYYFNTIASLNNNILFSLKDIDCRNETGEPFQKRRKCETGVVSDATTGQLPTTSNSSWFESTSCRVFDISPQYCNETLIPLIGSGPNQCIFGGGQMVRPSGDAMQGALLQNSNEKHVLNNSGKIRKILHLEEQTIDDGLFDSHGKLGLSNTWDLPELKNTPLLSQCTQSTSQCWDELLAHRIALADCFQAIKRGQNSVQEGLFPAARIIANPCNNKRTKGTVEEFNLAGERQATAIGGGHDYNLQPTQHNCFLAAQTTLPSQSCHDHVSSTKYLRGLTTSDLATGASPFLGIMPQAWPPRSNRNAHTYMDQARTCQHKVPLGEYENKLLFSSAVAKSTAVAALVYQSKVIRPSRKLACLHCTVLASLVVADKFLNDIAIPLSQWAAWASMSIKDVARAEKNLLTELNYKLFLTPVEFSAWALPYLLAAPQWNQRRAAANRDWSTLDLLLHDNALMIAPPSTASAVPGFKRQTANATTLCARF